MQICNICSVYCLYLYEYFASFRLLPFRQNPVIFDCQQYQHMDAPAMTPSPFYLAHGQALSPQI